ncbi:PCL7 [Candida metapsilosis]|uniref:PCL7 n=1 Tax=Candida metapsilosis TaxID=273372 RepID=A0A8H7ZDI1_9ASCO|nr:PCL7 [Candida metapsilosis]
MSTNYQHHHHHNDSSSTTDQLHSTASLDSSTNLHNDQGSHYDTPPQSTKSQVSNLTKTLQSSTSTLQNQQNFDHTMQGQQQQSQHITDPRELITGLPYGGNRNDDPQSTSYQTQQGVAFPQQIPITQNSYKHMPMSHNTPTAVGTSYTSAHSYNQSLPSTNNFITQSESGSFHHDPTTHITTAPSSFRPNTVPHAFPTTTVQTDSAIPNRSSFSVAPDAASSSLHSSSYSIPGNHQFQHPSMIHHPTSSSQFMTSQRIPNSLPVGPTYANSFPSAIQGQQQQQQQQQQSAHRLQSLLNADTQTGPDASTQTSSIRIPQNNRVQKIQQNQQDSFHSTPPYYEHVQQHSQSSQQQQNAEYVRPEPDHYLTYNEFLDELKRKDKQERPDSDEEHLNIVEFPVNDLIVMLSCLLTKIIEANDKLHPNHFENTIAIRQKIKEEKKRKKMQRRNRQQEYHERTIVSEEEKAEEEEEEKGSHDNDDDGNLSGVRVHSEDRMDEDDDHHEEDVAEYDDDFDEDEDEEDNEMKNKYLANVLAFHGTNVPGISLHAYLARVLKYCPVTNEVFLSLLVYFDRIAKKANNLNQKRRQSSTGGGDDGDGNGGNGDVSEAEQLFVMDSYNIHRLIISGITVSSKFFSDIFYKNLRYAKVGGLPLEELNYLELQFLLLLDFKLMISVEDLQNYGDLLARFWKREQQSNNTGDVGNTTE